MYVAMEELVMSSIRNYFRKHPENMERTVDIILMKKNISISLIEWFVVHHSPKENKSIVVNGKPLVVNASYKSQLKSYKKYLFDFFCRGEKIQFEYKKGHHIITGVKQLNCFKWLCESGILDYIEEHAEELKKLKE